MTRETFPTLQTNHAMEHFAGGHPPLFQCGERLSIIQNPLNVCGRLLHRNGVV